MAATHSYEWRGAFQNVEVNNLHAECFDHEPEDIDWQARLDHHSLGWVCARHAAHLIGFVNVVWDGGKHVFVLDLMVSKIHRHAGIAKTMMEQVIEKTEAAGCEWLHVDFEERLRPFYFDVAGFQETHAGLIRLSHT